MSDAVTLEVSPKALTDEQLSEALSIALASEDAVTTVALCRCGARVDPPEFVQQLLNEYKQRHRKPNKAEGR